MQWISWPRLLSGSPRPSEDRQPRKSGTAHPILGTEGTDRILAGDDGIGQKRSFKFAVANVGFRIS